MSAFDTPALLEALDAIGAAATGAGQRLELVVYGGSALMLAGNFRFSTEDVDIAAIEIPWPVWLQQVTDEIALRNGWGQHWLNDAVSFHLSQYAQLQRDHLVFGSFPRRPGPKGLLVHVPSAEYMLALKLKAMRVGDPAKGPTEMADIESLLTVTKIATIEDAIHLLARYFPRSAEAPDKQRFLLKHIFAAMGGKALNTIEDLHAPAYPIRGSAPPDDGTA